MARYATRSGARTPRRRRVTSEILAPVDAELSEALACVKRIHAQRHNRARGQRSWATLLAFLRAYAAAAEPRGGPRASAPDPEGEPTVTPEQTLREAGIDGRRQAEYQRKMSTLLAGRHTAVASCP